MLVSRALASAVAAGSLVSALILVPTGASSAPATAPSVVEYSQCANGPAPGSSTGCASGWINGVLQSSNSHYSEDQVTPQRLLVSVPAAGSGAGRAHSLTFRYMARKDSAPAHAYDSLSTWNLTQNADRCQGVKSGCPTGDASTFPIPDDPTEVTPVGPGISPATDQHSRDGVMTMFGGTITSVSRPVHSNPAAGTGDDYATITVTFTVPTSTKAQNSELLFGGHLAPGLGERGWGTGLGAGNISGGPYHIKLDLIDGASVGNRDNQIQAGAILPIGPTYTIVKTSNAPAGGVAPGADVTYSVKITNSGDTSGTTTFTDTYAPGVVIKTVPSGCTNDAASRTLTCTVTVPAKSSTTVSYTATMPTSFPDDSNKGLPGCTATQYRVQNTATLSGGATSTATVCVNAAAHFRATKTNNAPTSGVAPGATVTYTVRVTNDGSAPGSTSFTDKYASGVTITTVPSGCSDDHAGTMTCSTTVLAPGEHQDFSYSARMPATFTGTAGSNGCGTAQYGVVNKVTVNGTDTTSTVCVNAAPHFVPSKTVTPGTTTPGGTVTYAVTLTNDGSAPGSGVLTDVRSAGVTVTSGPTPAGCVTTNATTLTCTSPVLNPGGSITWTYQARMPSTFSGATGGDPCTSSQYRFGNTATAGGTSVTANVCVDVSPSFVISKSNNSPAGGVAPGATVQYTVLVTNNGTGPGSTSFTDSYDSGVTITGTLPAGCTNDATSHTLTCDTGTIAAGANRSFTYTATMPASFSTTAAKGQPGCGSDQYRVQNKAKLAGATSGAVSTVCVNAAPKLSSTKTASKTVANPGESVTYTVTVRNDGSAPGSTTFTDTPPTGVVITSTPAGCSLSNGTLTCTVTDLAPGTSKDFVYSATLPTSYTGALGGSPCTGTQLKVTNEAVLADGSVPSSSTVCVNMPVLSVTKAACTANTIPANGRLVYTISYANTGSAPATNTVLVDTIPAGTSVADAGGGTTSGRTVTWSLGTLAVGATGSKTLVIGVDPGTTGQIVNTARLTSTETSADSNMVTNPVGNQGASASGEAYGVQANVLGVLNLPPTPVATGNETKSLASLSNSVLQLGLLTQSNSSQVGTTSARDIASSTVADIGVNVLGLVSVHADAVVARSASIATGSTATSSTNGSEVLGLTINGITIGDVSSPRVIPVLNVLGIQIAEVAVLEETGRSGAALGGAAGAQPQAGMFNSGIGVNAIHIRLLNGTADAVVAHAASKAQFPTATPCAGSGSYVIGAAVIADEVLTVLGTPSTVTVDKAILPSTGGDVSQTVDAALLGPVVSGVNAGGVRTRGTLSPLHADSSASVTKASLLGGLLTADVISSMASADPGGALSGSTTIANLRVAGVPISVLSNPAPNTVIVDVSRTLVLVVNQQVVGSGNVITVNALHLYVLGAGNPLGLPVGSDLVVSGSTAGTSS